MKIVFLGCVEIGFKCLSQILDDGWDVKAIFTLPEKYSGNTSGFVDFSPLARRYGVTLYKIKELNNDLNAERIRRIAPDLIIVCGWQRLVANAILDIPKKGAVGFHSSLLPRYKGRAPVNWAIINNEPRTGVTMFYCNADADTGDIIAQKGFSISLSDTCATVYEKAAQATCQLIHQYLPKIKDGSAGRIKNESKKYKFWPKRSPQDGEISWSQNALNIHNWIRALTRPYPGAFTYHEGRKIFVWGSRYAPASKARNDKGGKIIKIINRNGRRIFQVSAADKPLYVYDLTDERGKSLDGFLSAGDTFVDSKGV